MTFQEELTAWLRSAGVTATDRVVAVPVCSHSGEQAAEHAQGFPRPSAELICVPEDRWRSAPGLMKPRILAHLGVFSQVYARNCEVRRIEKPEAAAFLSRAHSYGDASCRFRYGLFLRRMTGEKGVETLPAGTLVAVAEFSAARRWKKGDKVISSYEWVRYASLPGVRVVGGMGKMLKHFIAEVAPDDVMTYADLEWSDGEVYRRLGFVREGCTGPVMFVVDPSDWLRHPIRKGQEQTAPGLLYHCSPGSVKYRLKLTEY